MVKKSINKMSFGIAASSSDIVTKVFKSYGSGDTDIIRNLIENIIFINRIPSEWKDSHIVSVN